MILKTIAIQVRPGCRQAFLDKQTVWNNVMARQPGFLSVSVVAGSPQSDRIDIVTAWQDRASLDAFMETDHDRTEAETGIRETYLRCDVTLLDVLQQVPAAAAQGPRGLIEVSEQYRASVILRTALLANLFDRIGTGAAGITELARGLTMSADPLHRLLDALKALGLVAEHEGGWRLTAPARDHLLTSSPGYLGHLILHNTRPALWSRWGQLPETLGIAGKTATDDQTMFLRAMTDIAAAGQAAALAEHLDLTGAQSLLDIGGGAGDYAIALARRFPKLRCDVLDLPATASEAEAAIARAGLADRVAFIGGDYRAALPERRYDVILLSNILRGETPDEAAALTAGAFAALTPGGRLIVQDLFADATDPLSHRLAAFFALHLPQAMVMATGAVSALLAQAGFTDLTVTDLAPPVVANRLIDARRPVG